MKSNKLKSIKLLTKTGFVWVDALHPVLLNNVKMPTIVAI